MSFYFEFCEHRGLRYFQRRFIARRAWFLERYGLERYDNIEYMTQTQAKYLIVMGDENIIRSMLGWASFGHKYTYSGIHVLLKHFLSYIYI